MNKSNNKGFTLIEIIIAVSLIAMIAIMFANNLEGINRSTTQKSYDRMLNKILVATEAYVSNNDDVENEIKFGKGIYRLTVSDLIQSGFLDKDLIDPRTDANINREEAITIKYACDGKYKITYPVLVSSSFEFIEATPLVIDKLPNNISSADFIDLNSINFRLINQTGSVINLTSISGTLKNHQIKAVYRSFTPSTSAGVHKIIYNYLDFDNDCRQFTREVTFY